MEEKTRTNLERAVNACLEEAHDGTAEQAATNLKAAIEGYDRLERADQREEEKKNIKGKILGWIGGILTVLIPAIVVEGMQESFMDKQARRCYEFEQTGTITTIPGKNFVSNIFRPRRK